MLLTIYISAYRKKYFIETLKSFEKQNISKKYINEVEIIISDDNSPEGLFEVYKSFSHKIIKSKYYKLKKNLGGLRNNLRCTAYKGGKYTWIFGDDDCFYNKNSLQSILDILTKYNADINRINYSLCKTHNISDISKKNVLQIKKGGFFNSGKKFLKQFSHINYGSEFFGFTTSIIFKTGYINNKEKYYKHLYNNTEKYLFPHTNLICRNLNEKTIFVSKKEYIRGRISESYFPGFTDRIYGSVLGRVYLYKDLCKYNNNLYIKQRFIKFFLAALIRLLILLLYVKFLKKIKFIGKK